MPKLSIIIPCYNCEKTLREAVGSCYTQNFRDDEFEIVLVDDGSTDNTRSLIERLARTHNNISFTFHDQNKGGGATRNTAVYHAKGSVIFCLDSDDILPEGTLRKMYRYLRETGCNGVTVHRSMKFNRNNTTDISHVDISPFAGKRIPFNSLLGWGKFFCPLYVNFMYTREAFDKAGGYPTRHGFDTQGFAWRFACAGLVAYTCPDTEYLHRVNFNESYYLREYNSGKANFNWKKILMEHYYVFTPRALEFIRTFDCSNFNRDLVQELSLIRNLLIPNYEDTFGMPHSPLPETPGPRGHISRYSLRGYGVRLRHKVRVVLKKIALILHVSRTTIEHARRITKPPFLYFLSSGTAPISDYYGLDRGRPVDRFYIERFLEENKGVIRGRCLEVLNGDYTQLYGNDRVTKSDILDIDDKNIRATVVGDIRNLRTVPDNRYDCIILTQVLQFIDDLDAAISECHRILKPNGTILATLPFLSRIDCTSGISGDYWRFTEASARFIFEKRFDTKRLAVSSEGNARSGLYFYAGLAQEEISKNTLAKKDPNFPVIITVKAMK